MDGTDALPLKFWHACRRRDLDAVLARGLDPAASRSRSQAVYLADDRFTAENYACMDPGEEWCVLEVDASMLDPALLAPDDYEFPELLEAMDGDAAEEAGVDPSAGWEAHGWRESLAVSSQVRYFGTVPPAALSVGELSFGVPAGPAVPRG